MTKPHKDPLPPLEWLRVFEAAGRLASFTGAANELGLTQAAISQRIRNLESRLGVQLFRRMARGVELTADGEAYLPHVKTALDGLRRGTADLFGTTRHKVSIASPASVAALWLSPRLGSLHASHPNFTVSLSSVHRPADFSAADADFEVRFGNGDWPERDAVRLYEETLIPVCHPELLNSQPDWRHLPIIAVSGPRSGWRQWALASGEAPVSEASLRFDSFITALNAAMAGAGVMLASLPLSETKITSKALVPVSDKKLTMSGGYWLTWKSGQEWRRAESALISLLSEEEFRGQFT